MASNKDLNTYVDMRLREERPDRYRNDDPFLDDVASSIPDEMFGADALFQAKKKIVREREKSARQCAKKLMREFAVTGQLSLHWWSTANEPLSISIVDINDAGTEVKTWESVTLRAATPADFRAWARAERAAADLDHHQRELGCAGGEAMADAIEAHHSFQFIDWAESVADSVAVL